MNTEPNTTVYYDNDVDLAPLKNQTIAVLGYGTQGHAHAQNLADSGLDVLVGLREGSSSRKIAKEDGLNVGGLEEVTKKADIISVLVPDTVQPEVFEAIKPNLESGNTLQFAHGFNIHYNQIQPPDDVDVTMVAPKSPGYLVRRNYQNGEGTPGLVAVYQDPTDEGLTRALAYAKAIGCTRAGVIETSFKEETETDLFGEQAVLCGGVTSLIKMSYESLVDAGYSKEMAYFECMNELKLIVDLMYEGGLTEMWDAVSDTAEYGGLTRGDVIIDDHVHQNMEDVLEEIQNGAFATEWILENQAGRPKYNQLNEAERSHEIENVGEKLRKLFSWAEE